MSKEVEIKVTNYRPDIDGLRAIAVLLVLAYHIFPNLIKGGFIGVDIFFVISGYLISGIILNGLKENTFSFGTFFMRRIKRIFPVLLLVLLSSYILGWILLMPKEFKELNKHILGGVGFAANFTLWHDSGYFDVLPELKPLLHLWSLGIEEQFYLLWPLGLYWASRYQLRLMPIFLVTIFFSFIVNITLLTKYPEAIFYFPFSRFWELLIGASFALHTLDKPFHISKVKENILSWLGLILIAVATVKLNKHSPFPGWWATLPTMGALFLIAGKNSWINSRILSHRVFVWVGLISYPLYLWHWLIISFVYFGIGDLPFKLDRIAIIFLSFFFSWITYRFIETPIRHGKNSKAIVKGLLLLSLTIGVIGFITFRLDGIPSRMEKRIEAMPTQLREMLKPDFGGFIANDWREHSCFLAKGENSDQFKKECTDSDKKPTVFIWGDSHAAALYSGFKLFQDKRKFGIAQYTASACPPVLNWVGNINKLCKEINNYSIALIEKTKPDIVILQASWSWSEYDIMAVTNTIDALKKLQIKRIIIMGQSPTWKEKVPANIISFYRMFGRIPKTHTDFGLIDVAETVNADKLLTKIAEQYNVEFISIFRTLCTDQGCLLSTGDSITNVTSLDQGHLSKSAAEYVVAFSEKFFFDEENKKSGFEK